VRMTICTHELSEERVYFVLLSAEISGAFRAISVGRVDVLGLLRHLAVNSTFVIRGTV